MRALTACVLLWSTAALAQDASRDSDLNSRVHGTVVSDDGVPVPGAIVQLSGLDSPGAGRSRVWNELRTTGADGAFDYSNIPAGDYSVTASRPGYVMTNTGRVTASARRTVPVTIRMTRGGAITGRIVDAFGDPVSGINVQATPVFGLRLIGGSTGDVTDDRGQFRVYGLTPGEYLVVAGFPESPLQEPDRPTTFYPGTLDESLAQPLSVRAGQDVAVAFTLQHGRLYRVSGHVVSASGMPVADAQITLRSRGWLLVRPIPRTSSDGSFQLTGLAAGSYVIDVRKTRLPNDVEVGRADVTVGSEDVDGVSIVTARGATLTGTIVFEGDSTRRSLPIQVRQIDSDGISFGSSLTFLPGGRFEAQNVFGRVVFESADRSWMVKTVTLGSADVLDRGIDARNRETVSGIHIVVTDRLTTVSGRAVDSRGRPLANHVVVLFRTEGVPTRAQDGLRAVRTGDDGTFKEWGLRPGRYAAAVVETIGPGGVTDPDLQEQLRLYGHRFSLIEGQAVDLELEPSQGVR